MIQQLLDRWKEEFGEVWGAKLGRAPGRVNLIGEHTDYNDGFVLPCAIEPAVWILARAREDTRICLVSLNYNERHESDVNDLHRGTELSWSDYLLGVVSVFQQEGYASGGWDAVIGGDVPLGAGLSSSAAVEVATGTVLREMFQLPMEDREMALLCQRAENMYVGVQCGVMDQFASTFGKVDHALLLDCRSLEIRQVPAHLKDTEIVICDSKVQRNLSGSEYNIRRAQCREGVHVLREKFGERICALRDASLDDLEMCRERMSDPVYRRCRHVMTENPRVLEGVRSLESGDPAKFGRLMLESHRSLRDDYEVSCPELDLLVDLAIECRGVAGSRMTGAGFGGCTVSLVERSCLDQFCAHVISRYARKTGREPEIYVTRPGSGAAIVDVF
ncbi:MAG TPA: galactokinase [bacterium]|nr:galactokinase [bacterium]HQL62565.1 galactokinase [bacterium]